MKNKKAAEKYITPMLFIVWGMIAVAIIAAVAIIYSADGDFRKQEADILATKILDCLIDSGELINLEGFDVFDNCGINRKAVKSGGDFYFKVEIKGSGDFIREFTGGYEDLLMQCQIKNKEKHFAQCSERGTFVLSEGEGVQVNVIAASNQIGRKI